MKKNVIICSILFGFVLSCFILFAFPAVKGNIYYEAANGYEVMFGEVSVRQHETWVPSKINFLGVLIVLLFFASLILDSIAFVLCIKDNDKWATFARVGMIATGVFSLLYMYICECLPVSETGNAYVMYRNKGEPAGGAIFTGVLGIAISIISYCACFYSKKNSNF